MGLFGQSKPCPICQGQIRGNKRFWIAGGERICADCRGKMGGDELMIRELSLEEAKENIAYFENMLRQYQDFSPTKEVIIGPYQFMVDKKLGLWAVTNYPETTGKPPLLFKISELVGYEYDEKESRNMLSRSLKRVMSMTLIIKVNHPYIKEIPLGYLMGIIYTDSPAYDSRMAHIKQTVAFLDEILDSYQ